MIFRMRHFESLVGRRTLRGSRRGSTILIVLALLSLLVLLAITLTYTSRLETISTQNFAQGVQRDQAAITVSNLAAGIAREKLPKDALGYYTLAYELGGNQPIAQQRSLGGRPVSAKQVENGGVIIYPGVRGQTGRVRMTDLSSRININTADRDTIARALEFASADAGVSVNSLALANAIVNVRLGSDGAPGRGGFDDNYNLGEGLDYLPANPCPVAPGPFSANTLAAAVNAEARLAASILSWTTRESQLVQAMRDGTDEPDEYIADIRYPAFGDDRRWGNLAELLTIPGFPAEMLPAAEQYLTTFSMSQKLLPATSDGGPYRAPVDLNRSCVEDIYRALKDLYGSAKDDRLLAQFAVNIVDARDMDRRPTVFFPDTGIDPVLGLERTPVIMEVYPDSVTPEIRGDDGQYVEIYNPWAESFSLAGWSLRIGASVIPLTGTLPPNGYLVVTDDYDNSSDPNAALDLPGTGSLYDIFGIVSNGFNRRVIENTTMNLPDTPGRYRVDLVAPGGDLADFFTYIIPAGGVSTTQAFQRINPVVRESNLRRATPFTRIPPAPPNTEVAVRLSRSPRDMPFTDILQLFEVFAAYAADNGDPRVTFAFPMIGTPNSFIPDNRLNALRTTTIDARIVDIFSVEWTKRNAFAGTSPSSTRSSIPGKPVTAKINENVGWWYFNKLPIGARHGLVNVNTAGSEVLSAVGLSDFQIGEIFGRQVRTFTDSVNGDGGRGLAYERLSELLSDERVWADIPGTRLHTTEDFLMAVGPLFRPLTISSDAFLLEGTPVEAANLTDLTTEGPRVRATVALDQATPDLVSWRFVP